MKTSLSAKSGLQLNEHSPHRVQPPLPLLWNSEPRGASFHGIFDFWAFSWQVPQQRFGQFWEGSFQFSILYTPLPVGVIT